MSSKFTALAVGQGDSFLLERNDKKILFDGGKSKNNLTHLVGSEVQNLDLDVVVCSHNDADHANGLIGLLESCKVKEVWLPGRWREGIIRISEDRETFFYEICVYSNNSQKLTLEEIYPNEVSQSSNKDESNIEDCIEKLAENLPIIQPLSIRFYFSMLIGNRLFIDAIEAANRIIEIAVKAFVNGSKIRWFDYHKFTNSSMTQGGEPWMTPLNSIEVGQTTISKCNALQYLALTAANKESLVFASIEENEPGVVFTADSDLSNVKISNSIPNHNIIVTAPHHGSDANASVYKLFNDPIWIRSDMKSQKRPGVTYLKQPHRYCTICRNSNQPKKKIKFISNGSVWTPQNTSQCVCVKKIIKG